MNDLESNILPWLKSEDIHKLYELITLELKQKHKCELIVEFLDNNGVPMELEVVGFGSPTASHNYTVVARQNGEEILRESGKLPKITSKLAGRASDSKAGKFENGFLASVVGHVYFTKTQLGKIHAASEGYYEISSKDFHFDLKTEQFGLVRATVNGDRLSIYHIKGKKSTGDFITSLSIEAVLSYYTCN